jgi:hypothetical protein
MKNERDQKRKDIPGGMTGRDKGRQGIDKAPGEEPSSGNTPFTQVTQKGKNKNDGDPSRESDKPLDYQNI